MRGVQIYIVSLGKLMINCVKLIKIKIAVYVVVCVAYRGVKPLLTTLYAYNKITVQRSSYSFTLKYSIPKVDGNIDFEVLITNIVFVINILHNLS